MSVRRQQSQPLQRPSPQPSPYGSMYGSSISARPGTLPPHPFGGRSGVPFGLDANHLPPPRRAQPPPISGPYNPYAYAIYDDKDADSRQFFKVELDYAAVTDDPISRRIFEKAGIDDAKQRFRIQAKVTYVLDASQRRLVAHRIANSLSAFIQSQQRLYEIFDLEEDPLVMNGFQCGFPEASWYAVCIPTRPGKTLGKTIERESFVELFAPHVFSYASDGIALEDNSSLLGGGDYFRLRDGEIYVYQFEGRSADGDGVEIHAERIVQEDELEVARGQIARKKAEAAERKEKEEEVEDTDESETDESKKIDPASLRLREATRIWQKSRESAYPAALKRWNLDRKSNNNRKLAKLKKWILWKADLEQDLTAAVEEENKEDIAGLAKQLRDNEENMNADREVFEANEVIAQLQMAKDWANAELKEKKAEWKDREVSLSETMSMERITQSIVSYTNFVDRAQRISEDTKKLKELLISKQAWEAQVVIGELSLKEAAIDPVGDIEKLQGAQNAVNTLTRQLETLKNERDEKKKALDRDLELWNEEKKAKAVEDKRTMEAKAREAREEADRAMSEAMQLMKKQREQREQRELGGM